MSGSRASSRSRAVRLPALAPLSALLLAFAAAAAGCGGRSQASGTSDAGLDSAENPTVRREVRVEDVHILTGELKAIRSAQFTTPRSEAWNLQIKWLAEDGSSVGEGDRVIEFDNTAIAQGREEKRLRLIQAGVDLRSREAALAAERVELTFTLDSARSALDKARLEAAVPVELSEKRSWQDKQAAMRKAEAAEEKARLALASFEVSAKADLDVLRIAREKAEREVESVERDLVALTLTAPRAGIFAVGEHPWEGRKMQVGDTVWPGMELASIPDLSEMEVVGIVPEVDEGRVTPGLPVRCLLDTYPDRVFEGKLIEVSSVGKEATRRSVGGFAFRASLKAADPAVMRPGMSVRLEVVRQVWENALTVPRQSVQYRDGKAFVAGPAGAESAVRLAGCTPTRCVIEDGVQEGDRLALR